MCIDINASGCIGAFFAESIQGVGGAVPLADGFLPEVYDIVREHGGLCVSDEVQTGFGRTGSNFWGFENHGVMPDIVTMAKVLPTADACSVVLPLLLDVTTPALPLQ